MVSYARYRPEGYLSAFDIHILDVKPKHISHDQSLSWPRPSVLCSRLQRETKAAKQWSWHPYHRRYRSRYSSANIIA